MRQTLLCTTTVLFCAIAAAQEHGGPPPIIRVYVERLKPGKGAAHQKAEAAYVRAFAKAGYPAHYIALESMSGTDEAWFVEEHSSFAEIEQDEKASQAPALKAELEQAAATDGEYLSSTRSLIGVHRVDLSYRAEQATSNLPKMRYVEVLTFRTKPGTDQRLAGAIKDLTEVYDNIQFEQPVLVYQIISGAPRGTFLIFEPIPSLAEWDKYPAIMKSLRQTGGKKFQAVEAAIAEITLSDEPRLMSISPKMSYVSKEFASGDAEFWMPKPKAAAAKPAPKTSVKPAGQ